MSTGSFIAYHQRPNKAVERQLFIDLLTRINRFIPVSEYTYTSFGGTYFEDFKLVHSYFSNKIMVSIETDPTVFSRQPFNLPFGCIKLLNMSSDEFISNYESEKNGIIWLDYADARKQLEQLNEFYALLTKIKEGDVIKITLNANPSSLFDGSKKKPDGKNYNQEEIKEMRFEELKKRIGDYLPNSVEKDSMDKDGYPKVLGEAIGVVSAKAIQQRGDNTVFQPLTSFYYADSGNQMMTATGILINKNQQKDFMKLTRLNRWNLASLNWGKSEGISVPSLTAKEKTIIDQMLPCRSWKKIHKQLKFNFVPKDSDNIEIIEGYMKYYRYYPSYYKVTF